MFSFSGIFSKVSQNAYVIRYDDMLTLFNVNELNFLNDDGDKDRLRFIPSKGLELNYTKWDLLQRIFTEDIIVNPDTPAPEYPAIIQQLIDADPQPTTAAQIAQILSLYNPSDISEIIRQLIDADPQPTTREEVAQNVYAYPYEPYSAIYDYKFRNWTKIGSGNIVRNGDEYTFDSAGVQFNNIATGISTYGIYIEATIEIANAASRLFTFYNTLDTSDNAYPQIMVYYSLEASRFLIQCRKTTNGSFIYGSPVKGETFPTNKTYNLRVIYYSDNSVTLEIRASSTNVLLDTVILDSPFSFNPKNLRIGANKTYSTIYSKNLTIKKLKIEYNGNVISQWNK